jgi:hypothetical protein
VETVIVGVLLALGVGVAALARWSPKSSRRDDVRRVLWHLARLPIERFPVGRGAAVAGRVVSVNELLVAPLSGRSVVGYQFRIMDWDAGRGWQTVLVQTRCASFEIEDASGRARIDASGAELSLTGYKVDELTADSPRLQGLGLATARHPLRVEEWVLREGDDVAACGLGELEPAATGGGDYRQGAATRLVLRASAEFPLLVSNEPEVLRQPGRTVRLAV